MSVRSMSLFGLVALAVLAFADPALAAAGGGSMPYSPWITRITESLRGEVALLLAVMLFTVAFAGYLVQQELAGPLLILARGGIITACMLGVMTLIAAVGVGGAVVA